MEKSTETIYIGNLPDNITKEEIITLFSPFGKITHFRFAINHFTHQNLDYAFVQFENPSSIKDAIAKLDNSLYRDKFLIVNLVEQEN